MPEQELDQPPFARPEMALHTAARQPGVWVNWLSPLERALALWQFRHELHEELAR